MAAAKDRVSLPMMVRTNRLRFGKRENTSQTRHQQKQATRSDPNQHGPILYRASI
jgi:hypothetical protein